MASAVQPSGNVLDSHCEFYYFWQGQPTAAFAACPGQGGVVCTLLLPAVHTTHGWIEACRAIGVAQHTNLALLAASQNAWAWLQAHSVARQLSPWGAIYDTVRQGVGEPTAAVPVTEPLHEVQAPQEPQRTRAKQYYCPKAGSGAEAILIVLFKAHCAGEPPLGKDERLQRAETLGITKVSVYGNPDAEGSAAHYNAWSAVGQMVKNTHEDLIEAIVVKHGRKPVHAVLTPTYGRKVALAAYKAALERRAIAADPQV